MPMPYTYRHAQTEFAAFLHDAREAMALDSDNMTYTAVDGVFQTFRRRLTVPQALAFADLLPAILRAMFLWRWTPAPPLPFADRATLTADAQSLRPRAPRGRPPPPPGPRGGGGWGGGGWGGSPGGGGGVGGPPGGETPQAT